MNYVAPSGPLAGTDGNETAFTPRHRGRAKSAESSVRLKATRESVFAFEKFVDSLGFAIPSELSRLKLAGSEIFDNLVKHSAPLKGDEIVVRASRHGPTLFLLFYFKSPNFGSYAARCYDYEPVYDHHGRRWHGMGLRMARNLSSSITFRPGSLIDRIIIRF